MSVLNTAERAKYARLFDSCVINPSRGAEVDSIVEHILAHRSDYEQIGRAVNVPWYMVAVLHYRESSLNFHCHLHNGDPLTARTVHVPRNRPRLGTPPFSFVESAVDALTFDQLCQIDDISVANLLFLAEGYNGTGYKRRGINSPYLWSFTDKYSTGKYVADGTFDPEAHDAQCGIAAILLRLHERNEIALFGETISVSVNGKPTNVPAFVVRGNSFVGVRATVAALGGTVGEIEDKPFSVTVTGNGKTQEFSGAKFGGMGYVDASDLVRFFGREITLDTITQTLKIV